MEGFSDYDTKFTLCVLRTQLGKTFTTIARINTEIIQDHELGKSIHFVFTMNTLLNNRQFAKRLETIETTYGKGSICVFSSTYSGKYKHVTDDLQLMGLCADVDTCPKVVVMCSNTRRYDDGVTVMKKINKNKTNGIVRIFTYYDELHKYITELLRSQIEEIHNLDNVHGITALTASPDVIWKNTGFWSKLRLVQLDEFSDSNYAGSGDMIFNLIDDYFENPYIRPHPFNYELLDIHTLGFIESVLNKHPEILGEHTLSFIPAHKRRSGHNAVRDLVFSINPTAVVVVINGFEKTIQYIDDAGNKKTLALASDLDEEVCETISMVVLKNNLLHRPIVITGFLCVGMGQTLTHKSMGSFTSAIFGHLDLTNDDIYQLFGRITGRIKDWGDKYITTQVYCPTIIMHRCIIMEECAKNMVDNHNGEVVSHDDYIKPMMLNDNGKSVIDNIRNKQKKITKDKNKDKNKRVPVVIKVTEKDITDFKDKDQDKQRLALCILENTRNDKLVNFIKYTDVRCKQITAPESNNSYEKHITHTVNAYNTTNVFSIDLNKSDKEQNNWQLFIDNRENRLCFVIWSLNSEIY